jgi:Mn-dependent DtxR family transcriptional regulator
MKKSHESAEDYLESILVLRERKGNVRSIDIVNERNYSKPSISIAMKKLRSEGLVEMDLNGYITLTLEGEDIAQRIYQRHKLLTKVLVAIGVDEETAAEEACRIEHVIDDNTYDKISAVYEKHLGKADREQ